MPVMLEWHAALPVLMTTYQGSLSAADYRTMRARQRAMLADRPDRVVLLADLRLFEGFPNADTIKPGDTLLLHPQMVCVVVVVDTKLYHRLAQAILPADERRQVYFFTDLDAALGQAEARLRR